MAQRGKEAQGRKLHKKRSVACISSFIYLTVEASRRPKHALLRANTAQQWVGRGICGMPIPNDVKLEASCLLTTAPLTIIVIRHHAAKHHFGNLGQSWLWRRSVPSHTADDQGSTLDCALPWN